MVTNLASSWTYRLHIQGDGRLNQQVKNSSVYRV
jgi:hypothetical protein